MLPSVRDLSNKSTQCFDKGNITRSTWQNLKKFHEISVEFYLAYNTTVH